MAKKKVGSDELAVDGVQTPPLAPPHLGLDTHEEQERATRPANGEASEEVGYTVGAWSGFTQYRCIKCAFDTLQLEAIEEHVAKHKTTPPHLGLDTHEEQERATRPANGEGSNEDVFEVELKEVDSAVDKDGNEVKTYTVKEN